MASTQEIKRRIGTVKNTRQITKAMELVAASKMRRAQEASLRSRAFRNTAVKLLNRLNEISDVVKHPLFAERPITSRLYIVVTGDRGLAGAYNNNIFKAFVEELNKDRQAEVASKAIVIGKKGAAFASRLEGLDIIGVYDNLPDNLGAQEIEPILDTALNMFKGWQADEVIIVYTDYISTINQQVRTQRLLPAVYEEVDSVHKQHDTVFEPSPQQVIETITPRLVEVQLLQALLESIASEHSMRMMAMKNASDNAGDLIDDLTLVFNSARQSAITQELAEITGGAEAIA